jgi:hypothetical protein
MKIKIPLFWSLFVISALLNGWAGYQVLAATAILGSAFLLSSAGMDEDRGGYYSGPLFIGVFSITTLRLLTSDVWIDNLVLIIAISLIIFEREIYLSRLKPLIPIFRVSVASIPIYHILFILYDGLNEVAALLLVGSCLLASIFSWGIEGENRRLIISCGLLLGIAGWYFRVAYGIFMEMPDPIEAAQLHKLASYLIGPVFGIVVYEAISLYCIKSFKDAAPPISQESERAKPGFYE